MSTVTNYKREQSAQINLDDGSSVIISYGTADIKVIKLGLMSLPKGTLYTFDNSFTYKLTQKIGYNMEKDIVKILVDELAKASSLGELKKICKEITDTEEFINKVL